MTSYDETQELADITEQLPPASVTATGSGQPPPTDNLK